MDIVVHGTKGGRKIFTPKRMLGLLDVSSDTSKATAIGQQAYSIRFTVDNTIFSKYKIVRDVRGDKRTGFVGFSLFMPNNKKLSGTDIITALDKVSEKYCQQYIADNNLNEITEDWAFLDRISSEYDAKLHNVSIDDAENMQSGDKDDAFIYFKEVTELQKYFDAPFKEEYTPYRQILFVSSDLRGNKPESPLNALRHSENDLTGKIDLENPEYKLLFNQDAKVQISVKINGSTRSNKSKIRRKNDLEISWTKPYYQTVQKCGKWYEIDNSVIVDDNAQTVTVKELELQPEEKIITLKINDREGNPVTDAEIQIDTKPWFKGEEIIKFKGEEIIKSWTVSAKKGNLMSESKTIIPEQINNFELILEEQKVVKIIVTSEDGKEITKFKVWTNYNDKKGFTNKDEIIFKGAAIREKWNISVDHDDYDSKDINNYCPATGDNPIRVKLKKKASNREQKSNNDKVSFCIYVGEHGKMYKPNEKNKKIWDEEIKEKKYEQKQIDHLPPCLAEIQQKPNCKDKKLSLPKDGFNYEIEIEIEIEADFGYRFDKWKSSKQEENHYEFTAQFKPLITRRQGMILLGVTLIITFVWAFYYFCGKDETHETPLNKSQIQMYVEGDSLFIDKLNDYKENWEKQVPKGAWWQNLFGGGEQRVDSTAYKDWETTYQKIESAIALRKLINDCNFAELKKREDLPEGDFKNSILKLDSTYQGIKDSLMHISDLDTMPLSAIAQRINDLEKEAAEQKKKEEDTATKQRTESSTTTTISSSVNLETEFFKLIQKGNNQMDNYKALYDKYKSANNQIIAFLKDITKDSRGFGNFKDKLEKIPAMDKQKIKTLTELKSKLQ
jgi:hypothetical protein